VENNYCTNNLLKNITTILKRFSAEINIKFKSNTMS
jgi:hypothetical protein